MAGTAGAGQRVNDVFVDFSASASETFSILRKKRKIENLSIQTPLKWSNPVDVLAMLEKKKKFFLHTTKKFVDCCYFWVTMAIFFVSVVNELRVIVIATPTHEKKVRKRFIH